MNILFWNQEYLPSLGGVEIYTRNLARALVEDGHSVSVITSLSHPELPARERIEGVSVHRLPFFQVLSSRNIESIAALRAQVAAAKNEANADIVQVNFTDASPFFHLRTRRPKERSILVFHSPLDSVSDGMALANQLVRESHACIAISEFMQAHLSKKLIAAAGKLELIRNGADAELFGARAPEPSTEPVFLFAGRLVDDKGADIILRALHLLKQEGRMVRLKLVGAGPQQSALEEMAREFGLIGQVEFAGRLSQTDLARSIRQAVAVIMPSRFQEPAPLVAVEVSMAGVPIIGARIGGIPDVVEDGKTGLLFEPEDAADLAQKIKSVMDTPDLAERMGNAARRRAKERYSLTGMIDQYMRLYRRVLDQ